MAKSYRGRFERARGRDFLGNISDNTLYAQLDRQAFLAGKDPGRYTVKTYTHGGGKPRVLHIKTAALWPADEEPKPAQISRAS